MKIRTRIAIVFAVGLVVAGSLTLVVNALAFEDASYQTWSSYREALIDELGISRETALAFVKAHPELFFETPGDTTRGPSGKTVDEASQAAQHDAVTRAVDRSRRWTLVALGAVVLGAVAAGWFVAGRILRPVRLVTKRARAASALDLDTRVSLRGPNDEMKELADTFDAMLDRLARSFDTQRSFSAQAAHELRTPLAVTRSEIDLLLADVDDAAFRTRLEAAGDATGRAERLVSQLLILSRTDTRDLGRSAFAFDELVGNVVGRAVEGRSWPGLRVELELHSTTIVGDRALLESLVRNLVDNAGRHNRGGGWVRISVEPNPEGAGAVLEVSNSVAARVELAGDGHPGAPHIGLSIVAAVVDAHEGAIEWHGDAGSVTVRVELPAVPAVTLVGAGLTTVSP